MWVVPMLQVTGLLNCRGETCCYLYLQDLQRRLDLERADRNKADSATLKLLSELKEDSQRATELRDQESRLVASVLLRVILAA